MTATNHLSRSLDDQLLAQVAIRTDNPVIITDPAGHIRWVNDGFTRFSGYSATEAHGRRPGDLLQGPATDPATRVQMRDGLRAGIGFTVDVLNYRKDGREVWLHLEVRPVVDEADRIIHFIGIGTDITDRRIQEQALRRSEDRFRTIVSTAQEGIWLIDRHAITTFVNARMATMLGYAVTEMMDKPIYAFMDEIAIAEAKHHFERRTHGLAETYDFRLCRRDGTDLWTRMATNPVLAEDGAFMGALALVTDISTRRQQEARLAAAHAENELLLQTIPSAIIGLDVAERITRWNGAAEAIFGLKRDDVLGKQMASSGLDLEWADLLPAMNACLSEGRPVTLHGTRFRRADGSEGFLDIEIASSWATHGDGSEGLGMILLLSDVTERKIATLHKQQSQRMESIGQLAAGVAHEINTPIQFIGDNLRFLRDGLTDYRGVLTAYAAAVANLRHQAPQDPCVGAVDEAIARADLSYLDKEMPSAIAQSLDGVTRVAEIVRAMKEFSHPDQGEKKPADLNQAIQTTLTVARNEYKYVAELRLQLAEHLPLVPCIIGEFNQVILNLVINAAHAIGDVVGTSGGRGSITITTQHVGDTVEIRIADTGTGIPASARAKVFDPFFTTKPVGKGTGQGLYIAHTVIVKKHGGLLDFETQPGSGTCFIIRLPLVARSA